MMWVGRGRTGRSHKSDGYWLAGNESDPHLVRILSRRNGGVMRLI